MKEFIVATLVLIILVMFIVQFGLEMRNHSIRSYLHTVVDAIKTDVRVYGGIRPDTLQYVITTLAKLKDKNYSSGYDLNDTGISYKGEAIDGFITYNVPKFGTHLKGEFIEYEFGIRIDQVMAAYRLFGLIDNSITYRVRGVVVSEYVE